MQQLILISSVAYCCLSHTAAVCLIKRNLCQQRTRLQIKRAKAAAGKRKTQANENPDQMATRRASNTENMQSLRDSPTPEQVKGPIKCPAQELT